MRVSLSLISLLAALGAVASFVPPRLDADAPAHPRQLKQATRAGILARRRKSPAKRQQSPVPVIPVNCGSISSGVPFVIQVSSASNAAISSAVGKYIVLVRAFQVLLGTEAKSPQTLAADSQTYVFDTQCQLTLLDGRLVDVQTGSNSYVQAISESDLANYQPGFLRTLTCTVSTVASGSLLSCSYNGRKLQLSAPSTITDDRQGTSTLRFTDGNEAIQNAGYAVNLQVIPVV